MLTPEQLAEIEERANAATPGPWEAGDVWHTAGVIFDDHGERVGPERGTRCTVCRMGEPAWVGRTDINGTVMRAHRHRDPDPYAPEHRISGPDGGTVAGNYDYEAGGILRAEDTAFIIAARTAVPELVAAVRQARDAAVALEQENARIRTVVEAMADRANTVAFGDAYERGQATGLRIAVGALLIILDGGER